MKKQWYDYLWIFSTVYLVLGFFNILFAWVGLLCFFIPLIISVAGGGKGYCNRYCGRGQLFSLLGGRFGLSRRKDPPKFLRSKWFRYGFLLFFFTMFFQMLWSTWLVFSEARSLSQMVTILWTFKLPWHWVCAVDCAVRLWILQRDADIHDTGYDYNGAVQASFLVCVLPNVDHDTAYLQS